MKFHNKVRISIRLIGTYFVVNLNNNTGLGPNYNYLCNSHRTVAEFNKSGHTWDCIILFVSSGSYHFFLKPNAKAKVS